MNCYADVTRLKRYLPNMSSVTTHDTAFLELLNAASRQIDKYIQRHCYTKTETKYFDGAGSELLVPDLLSITTLKTDDDGDATYENTFATTDYNLYGWGKEDALNRFPKIKIKISEDSDYSHFAQNIDKGVEIAGVWGYGDGESATPYSTSGDSVQDDGGINSTTTTITVTADTNFGIGQTILIESEQCYISAIDADNEQLTVTRGVNGTTAASHDKDTTIYIYQYPDPIAMACVVQTLRWWKRKDSAFQDTVSNPETGMIEVYKGLDPDIKLVINEYRRGNFA